MAVGGVHGDGGADSRVARARPREGEEGGLVVGLHAERHRVTAGSSILREARTRGPLSVWLAPTGGGSTSSRGLTSARVVASGSSFGAGWSDRQTCSTAEPAIPPCRRPSGRASRWLVEVDDLGSCR